MEVNYYRRKYIKTEQIFQKTVTLKPRGNNKEMLAESWNLPIFQSFDTCIAISLLLYWIYIYWYSSINVTVLYEQQQVCKDNDKQLSLYNV